MLLVHVPLPLWNTSENSQEKMTFICQSMTLLSYNHLFPSFGCISGNSQRMTCSPNHDITPETHLPKPFPKSWHYIYACTIISFFWLYFWKQPKENDICFPKLHSLLLKSIVYIHFPKHVITLVKSLISLLIVFLKTATRKQHSSIPKAWQN